MPCAHHSSDSPPLLLVPTELEIPFFLDRIKCAVRSEFDEWLSVIRERSQQLGQAAMEHTQKKLQRVDQRRAKQRQRLIGHTLPSDEAQAQAATASSMDGASATTNAIVAFAEADDEDEGLLDAVAINFAPVYQCLHIYATLAQQHRFTRLYKRKRRAQVIQAMELPARLKEQSVARYNFAFFSSVAGFFVLEDSIAKGDNELMSRAEVDGLFDLAVQKVRAVVKEQTAALSSVKEFLSLKTGVVVLRETMDSYGMRVGGLLDLMKTLRERFELIVLGRFQWEMKQALKTERWQPLTLKSVDEYRDKVTRYQLAPPLASDASFPVTVPFSSSLPAVCAGLTALIDDYFVFSQYVDDSHTLLLRAVDTALMEHVNGPMLSLIDNSAIHVLQAVQLAIHAAAMNEVCSYIEYYLGTYINYLSTYHTASAASASARPVDVHDIGSTGGGDGASGSVDLRLVLGGSLHLASRTLFAQTRIRCEDVLFELIDRRIDDFLSALHSPDLTPSDIALEPSDYVTDLTSYLDSTFAALTYIAGSVRDTLYFTSARHIASCLSSYLLTTLKRFNTLGVYNFNQDLQILENWARRCPVSGLVECFSECRQLMDAVLRVDLDELPDAAKRERELPHLSAAKLVRLLDKFKDLPSSAAKAPEQLSKVKRRQVDVVLKKLQAQIPQQR